MTSECHATLAQVAFVHGPVEVGNCDACHGPEQTDHKFPLKRTGNDMCTLCHVALTGRPFVHEPVELGRCVDCHAAHGASTKGLLAATSLEALCRNCHPATTSGVVEHQPFADGACAECHPPHEADNEHLTYQSGAKHCYLCHGELEKAVQMARSVHAPMALGCTTCHDAHLSEFEKLLVAEPTQHCLSCHSDVDDRVRTATAQHGAVLTGRQCRNCHDAHASTNATLLRGPLTDVCLSCHDKPIAAYDGREIPDMRTALRASRFLHGPVVQGECQACHRVHGSSNARLLRTYFSDAFYEDFDLTNYALCFSCHEEALVLDREVTTLTGFRNGSKNLHYLHVNRMEKGRTCKVCHEIHGSNLPKHIAVEVPFEGGGWALPLGFQTTPTGGRCAPGCHQPYEYNQQTPVDYSATP